MAGLGGGAEGAHREGAQALHPSIPKLYYHGEPLSVNVHVTNNSAKTVKKIRVSGKRQGWTRAWGRLPRSGVHMAQSGVVGPEVRTPPLSRSVPCPQ